MSDALSYADAVRLLGGQKNRFVETFDRLTGGVLLAGSVPVPALLGLFDAKAEFVRLGHDLVRAVSERRSGLSRYDRTRRLEAAHAVIAVTAYFEALAEVELPADPGPEKIEQLTLAGARPADPRSVVEAFFALPAPVPGPHLPYPELRARLFPYYSTLSARFSVFLAGLAGWQLMPVDQLRAIEDFISDEVPGRAVDRHRELLTRLATDFPEVAFWIGLDEHAATRAELRELTTGLAELRRTLDEISTGAAPDDRRAALHRAYAAELDRPIVPSGDVPAELRLPTLGAAYVPPLCRVAELAPGSRAGDESWWAQRPVRVDLPDFLTGYLTSPGAVRAPLLVLGQPGSGKSVLTRILAARLPPADFMVVRVVLRDVSAAADIQEQIEQAIRIQTGERVEWPALARSAGDALPVVLLDGFDELLQATGVSQSDYLVRVARFAEREATQGRPVAVLVTTRTSVADRAQSPPGTVALRLEPFDDDRVARWLTVWNSLNAAQFSVLGVRPLDPATVLAHRELAEQPLLLLMLALYDAGGGDLAPAGDLRRGELYERLLRSFARREVVKHRPGLSVAEQNRAVEDELRRLSVVAFAMFNRGTQWVTEAELEADLATLPFGSVPAAARTDQRAPLRAAEIVLGRFFFVHRSQASRDGDRPTAYEFLHATFGEFLVARLTWLVVDDLVARESAASLSLGGVPVDDDLPHALLSYAMLSGRAPVLAFLVERSSTLDVPIRDAWTELLVRLFRAAPYAAGSRRFDGYRPLEVPVPARYAAYTANLLLLILCVAGEVTGRRLYPGRDDVVRAWSAQALSWRAQLPMPQWVSVVQLVVLRRLRDEAGRDVSLSLSLGDDVTVPPIDIGWSYWTEADDGPDGGAGPIFYSNEQDALLLRRKAHFECAIDGDVVQHALDPLTDHLSETVNVFAEAFSGLRSPANDLLTLLLGPWGDPIEGRIDRYERCLRTASSLLSGEAERLVALVLDLLAMDRDVPARAAMAMVRLATDHFLVVPDYNSLVTPVLRCCLSFAGRDRLVDRQISALLARLIDADRSEDRLWIDELALELRVRLHELGIPTLRIDPADATWLTSRIGDRRPDLVARLQPLITGEDARIQRRDRTRDESY
ncbi:NACHT domain-containing protein [Plantactinospora sp. GCM10030261]|uniref:NACHT domain-containing protein n=1 Tax=Plantactinospora sp. GCM10030261 TaxID=3273420 RepID=UPI00360655C6